MTSNKSVREKDRDVAHGEGRPLSACKRRRAFGENINIPSQMEYAYVHALKGHACAHRPGLPLADPSGKLTRLARIGAHVTCVPRLRLRHSFSRTLSAHVI